MRLAAIGPEELIKTVGRDLMPVLKAQGQASVREIVTEANKHHVAPDDLPYVFWALANPKVLPDLGPRQKGYQLVIDIMARTGTMPAYQRAFKAVDDAAVDDAVDAVAQHMATWAYKDMLPYLMGAYVKVLSKYAGKVSEATGGQVPTSNGVAYLNRTFREILTLRSSWFEDGELLRRAVRFIPEW